MRTRACGWLAGVGLGLLAGLSGMAQAGPKLGVVDVGQVIRQCKKREDKQKGIVERVKKEADKLDELNKQIEKVQSLLRGQQNPSDLEARQMWELQLAELRGKAEAQQRWVQIINNLETGRAMRELFDDVKKAVEEVATREKYDLVAQVMSPPNPDEAVDVLQEIVRKPVIYYNKQNVNDVTATVLAQVDMNFQKEKAQPPPAPPKEGNK